MYPSFNAPTNIPPVVICSNLYFSTYLDISLKLLDAIIPLCIFARAIAAASPLPITFSPLGGEMANS